MNISSAVNSASLGMQIQQQRLQQNVEKVAGVEATVPRDTQTQDRALVEQIEIVSSLQANARSLEAANQRIGTLVDLKV
jgi:hypothetical protein